MTTLTTERLQELRDRIDGTCPHASECLYLRDYNEITDTDAERDIIAALSRLIEAEKELTAIKAQQEQQK